MTAPSKMTKAELLAEVRRLSASNGQGDEKKSNNSQKTWTNFSGVECKSKFTARISSVAIVRHLTGACGCDPDVGFRCKAVKKYGYDYDTLATDPSAKVDPALLTK